MAGQSETKLLRRHRRWLRWSLGLVAALLVASIASVPVWSPALAAAACPACYRLDEIAPRLFADAAMSSAQRGRLLVAVSEAEAVVGAYFGRRDRQPIVLACSSDDCDRRLGGRGARAVTYSTVGLSVLRLSPRGLDRTVIAHELSHVQVHTMIGVRQQVSGALAAWFDEGLAVIVSQDERYLHPGAAARERCMETQAVELPTSPFVWGPKSGKTPWIYARAACDVMRWLEANGGRAGLLAAIAAVGDGRRTLP